MRKWVSLKPVAPPSNYAEQMWKSHKVVEAEKIVRLIFDDESQIANVVLEPKEAIFDVPNEIFARGTPEPGDYLVKYEDGYISWSPAKAFEEGYTLVG